MDTATYAQPPTTVPTPRPPATRRGRGRARLPWALALPALALVLALMYAPTIAGSYYAFTQWDGFNPAHWTGLENFREIFQDPTSRGALWNTIAITVAFVVIANVLGLALALGLNRTLKSRQWLRALFFAPVVVSPVAIGYLWQYILQTDGPLNTALSALGLTSLQHAWLGEPTTALWSILIVLLWQLTGLLMIIYLAGLSGIPDQLYEAAAVDGASVVRQFRRITAPGISAAIAINITLSILVGFRLFDQVIALTNGGPANSTQTLGTEIYVQAFTLGRFGYSAAIALLVSVLLVLCTLLRFLVALPFRRRG